MKLHRKAVEEVAYWLFLYLVTLEIFAVTLYLCILLLTGQAFSPLNVEGKMTIPSFLQAFQLLITGVILLIFFRRQRSSNQRPSRLFLLIMAVLLLYAALDEVLKIHLLLYQWFPSLQPRNQLEAHLFLFVATVTFFYRDFLIIWQLYRRETLLILLGMGIFASGEVSSENIKLEALQPLLRNFLKQRDLMAIFVEKLKMAVEELAAMIGESVILYGVLLFTAKRIDNKSSVEEVGEMVEYKEKECGQLPIPNEPPH